LKPSFKVINSPSKSHQKVTINHKIVTILFIIFFISFSITAIPPESASAGTKKNKSITKSKSNNSVSKNNRNGSKHNKNVSKNNKNSSKSSKKVSKKEKKSSSSSSNRVVKIKQSNHSELFAYFSRTTGNQSNNYTEYKSVVKKNETIVDILKPYGLTHADIFEFAKKNKKVFNLRQMKAGRAYSIISAKKTGKKATCLVYERAPKKYLLFPIYDSVNCNDDDSPKVSANTTEQESINSGNQSDSDIRIKQVSGIIKTSLHKTAARMGLNKKLTNQLTGIFKNTSALSNLRKGDMVQVAYQEKYVNGKRVKTGVITAAIITSKNKSYHAYRFTYNGKHGYYDENGNGLESSFLKAPLKYREISSGFSTRRFHPIKQIYQPHPGIDYAAPQGTPIKSVGDGIVIFKGYADSAGNYMKIKHPGTGISEYMHMSRFNSSIKVNKRVSKGDIIGYVGATGYATGPHLDLRFMVNNRYVDYRKIKLPHGNPLPRRFRNIFLQQVAMVNKQWNRTARRELSMNSVNTVMEKDYYVQHKL